MTRTTGQDGVWTAVLDDPQVRAALARARTVRHVQGVGEVGSTQDHALELARAGAPGGTVVIADVQRAGRGRIGRRWDDAPDGGTLALTLLLDAGMDADPLVPHALGLAVTRACESASEAPGAPALRLKWPNDVVVRPRADGPRRKLAGILIERERISARDVLLCGIGIDVDLRHLPEIEGRTCLARRAGTPPDRSALLVGLLTALDEVVTLVERDPRELLRRYRASSDTIGRDVAVRTPDGRDVMGTAIDIDDGGRLLVRAGPRTEVILSGTVRDVGEDEPGARVRAVVADGQGRAG